ncbi:MAG: L,D-transpeptidase [Gammaproteobacteria bacterium]
MHYHRLYFALLLLLIPFCAYGSFPSSIQAEGQKKIIVDPNIHMWAAYDEDGKLVKSGLATAGNSYCRDIHRSCRTKSGTFRIYSLGESDCRSHKFPVGRGGAPMPYCMFFNHGQALHGSHEVVHGNISHGCVRLRVKDARWLRYNFAEEPTSRNESLGTIVIVKPYD